MTTLVPNGVADPNLERTFTGMIFDHSKDRKKRMETHTWNEADEGIVKRNLFLNGIFL